MAAAKQRIGEVLESKGLATKWEKAGRQRWYINRVHGLRWGAQNLNDDELGLFAAIVRGGLWVDSGGNWGTKYGPLSRQKAVPSAVSRYVKFLKEQAADGRSTD